MKNDDYLSEEGQKIFKKLHKHCKNALKLEEIDAFELRMLANSFAMYADAARVCNEEGTSMTFITEKGEYKQIRPEYTVMKNEYQNILKHSAKFGLNPGDRKKIFNVVKEEERKESEFDKV